MIPTPVDCHTSPDPGSATADVAFWDAGEDLQSTYPWLVSGKVLGRDGEDEFAPTLWLFSRLEGDTARYVHTETGEAYSSTRTAAEIRALYDAASPAEALGEDGDDGD